MRSSAVVVLLALLGVGLAWAGPLEVRELEDSQAPGVTQQAYLLVGKDAEGKDQVVGHVLHIQTGGHSSLGRKIGLGFAAAPGPVLAGGVGMGGGAPMRALFDSLDLPVAQLFSQMGAARCAMMRQARDDFSLLNQQLGGRFAPLFLNGAQAEPQGLLFGADADAQPAVAELPPPFALLPPPGWHMGWRMRRDRGEPVGVEGSEPGRHHHHHMGHYYHMGAHHVGRLWHRLLGSEERGEVPPFIPEWTPLQDTAMPAPSAQPAVNWSLRDADGNPNWGFIAFIFLSAACAAVWAAGIASYLAYCRHMRASGGACPARRGEQFLTDGKGELLSPLLPEGPQRYTGVEFAADYAVPAHKEGYEPVARL